MNDSTDRRQKPGFLRQLNRGIGKAVNGIEVSILVFCVAALAIS